MAVGAQGSAFKLLAKQEVTEGTPPTGDYQQLPCYAFDLTPSQDLQNDQILSAGIGRDAGDPFLDALRVSGNGRVPVDLVNFGVWLKLALGQPTSTGTTDYTHVYTSGGVTLPTATFEKGYPDAQTPTYELLSGVRVGGFSLDFSPQGPADATLNMMGLGATTGNTSVDTTPTIATGFQRFLRKQGRVDRDGTRLGLLTAATMAFSNNFGEVRTIRDDDRLEGMDIGQATAEGTLTVRLNGPELLNDATNFVPKSLAFSYTISATKSLTFAFPRCFLSRTGIAVNGPLGIELPMRWRASGSGGSPLMTVTLKNQVATY